MKESTRIRYNKNDRDSKLYSKLMFSKEGMVFAVLDPVTKSFEVYENLPDKENNRLLGRGAAKNMAHVKKMVKEELKKLGVNFLDEVRNVKTKEDTDVEN